MGGGCARRPRNGRGALALWTLLVALLTGCGDGVSDGDGQTGLSGTLTLTGSSTVAPLAHAIAQRFEARHERVQVDVQAGGSARGITDAGRGTADIGMSSRALHTDERERLRATVIARDGIAVIVHADNPVTGLQRADVRALFTGRVDHWDALNGPGRPVTVVQKAAGRATREVFIDRLGIPVEALAADTIAGSNQQAMQTVAGQPGAVGYVSIGHAEREIADGLGLRLVALDGVAATSDRVAAGDYPIARPLVLVTRPDASSPLIEAFLAYARSSEVADLIGEAGYVAPDG